MNFAPTSFVLVWVGQGCGPQLQLMEACEEKMKYGVVTSQHDTGI